MKVNNFLVSDLSCCDNCGCCELTVKTENNNSKTFYDGDEVECSECGSIGHIQVDDNVDYSYVDCG